jgi:hypothetical protein
MALLGIASGIAAAGPLSNGTNTTMLHSVTQATSPAKGLVGPGFEQATSDPATVPAHTVSPDFASASATCPAGDTVVCGGGSSLGSDGEPILIGSFPCDADQVRDCDERLYKYAR